jgi:ABC-2 type transport system ATP-binding protein
MPAVSGYRSRKFTQGRPMLEARNLQKSFGQLQAVDDISFTVRPGELLGLLGPNGAGKTTTISMLTGLTDPDAGQVLICNEPLRGDTDPHKRRIGLIPQDLALYEELSAEANLRFFGALFGIRGEQLQTSIDSALALVGLTNNRRGHVKDFSGGMKRRLNLAAGILHDPDILLLDEPTVGIDPQSRNAIFDNLATLKQRGKTILYTTHYMEEVERLADRVVIIDHGRVIADESLSALHARVPEVNGKQATLEDVFLALTGRQLRD